MTSILMFGWALSACESYPYAANVKLMAFDDSLKAGTSIGPVRGEDCAFTYFGSKVGTPTIDKAIEDIRNQNGSKATDALGKDGADPKKMIRYVKNVSTSTDGFHTGIVDKDCIVVKGAGYR